MQSLPQDPVITAAFGVDSERTDDSGQAEWLVSQIYLGNELDLSGSDAALAMRIEGARFGELTAGRLTYGRDARLTTDRTGSFLVDVVLAGEATVSNGLGQSVRITTGQGAVLAPGGRADVTWSADCILLRLMVSRVRLEGELEALLGRALDSPLVFDFALTLDSLAGARLTAILGLALAEVGTPVLAGFSAAERHLEAVVLGGLLLAQRHNHTEALLVRRREVGRTSSDVQRAVTLLESDPGSPWGTPRLAREVHLSVRALQEGFAREIGIAPMLYLRRVRLRRAREALREPQDGTTVRTVASQVGIGHLGRFAQQYREQYGELPSVTLAAGRAARPERRPDPMV